MKKSLSCFVTVLAFALSAQAKNPLVCSNSNQGIKTILVLDNNLLMGVCQKSSQDEGKKNDEICANDEFVLKSNTPVNNTTTLILSSVTTGVIFTLTLDQKQNALSLNSNYSVPVIKGDNAVEISAGNMNLTCK